MSYLVVTQAMKHSEARHGTRLVMWALAEAADPVTGICWVRQDWIQDVTRLSEREVREALRWLERNREIETRQAQRGRVRVNVYRVIVGTYADVDVTDSPSPFRLLEPFSRPADSAARQDGDAQPLADSDVSGTKSGRPADSAARGDLDDRQTLPPARSDDRQNTTLTTGRIGPKSSRVNERSVEPETRGSSEPLVPAEAGESEQATTHRQLVEALAEGLNRKPATRSEHGLFGAAAAELADAAATPALVLRACRRFAKIWPNVTPTPKAIVLHWSLLNPPSKPSVAAAQAEQWVHETSPSLEDFDQVATAIESMRPALGNTHVDRLLAAARTNWERRHAAATVGSAA